MELCVFRAQTKCVASAAHFLFFRRNYMKQPYTPPEIKFWYLETECILSVSGNTPSDDPASKYDPENDPDAGEWIG